MLDLGKTQIRFWNTTTRQEAREPIKVAIADNMSYTPADQLLHASNDGSLLVLSLGTNGGNGGYLAQLYNSATGQKICDISEPPDHGVLSDIAVDPNGKTLGTATVFGKEGPRLWNTDTCQSTATLPSSSPNTDQAEFSPDGAIFATSVYRAPTVELWDTGNRNLAGRLSDGEETNDGHGRFTALTFSSDGTVLATGKDDGTVQLWDPHARRLADRQLSGQQPESSNGVNALAFSPDGSLLAVANTSGVRLWNVGTGLPVEPSPFAAPDCTGTHVAFSPDGTTIAAALSFPCEETGMVLAKVPAVH